MPLKELHTINQEKGQKSTKSTDLLIHGYYIEKSVEKNIIQLLRGYGALTRPEIVKLTGVPRSTLYDALRRLIQKGIITTFAFRVKNTGRPMTKFSLCSNTVFNWEGIFPNSSLKSEKLDKKRIYRQK